MVRASITAAHQTRGHRESVQDSPALRRRNAGCIAREFDAHVEPEMVDILLKAPSTTTSDRLGARPEAGEHLERG